MSGYKTLYASSCHCAVDCCSMVADPMRPGERLVQRIDITDIMADLGDLAVAELEVGHDIIQPPSNIAADSGVDPFDVTEAGIVNTRDRIEVVVAVTAGAPGAVYAVSFAVTTCSGNKFIECFRQGITTC